jgi:hypothetical protein
MGNDYKTVIGIDAGKEKIGECGGRVGIKIQRIKHAEIELENII